MPELCRLEKRAPDGTWKIMHAGVALLHPQRYVERLALKGIQGRCTILDDDLQPTAEVYLGPEPTVPDAATVKHAMALQASAERNAVAMPTVCDLCNDPTCKNSECLL